MNDNDRFELAVARGRLLRATLSPLEFEIFKALEGLLEQGGEGLVPMQKAVEAATAAAERVIKNALKEEQA